MFDNYEEILTIEDIMVILGIGKNSAYELLRTGEIKAFRLKGRWKIPKKSVSEYILSKSSIQTSK